MPALVGVLFGLILEHQAEFLRVNSASVDGILGSATTLIAAYWIGVLLTRKNSKQDQLSSAISNQVEIVMGLVDGLSRTYHELHNVTDGTQYPLAGRDTKSQLQQLETRVKIIRKLCTSWFDSNDKFEPIIDSLDTATSTLNLLWTSPTSVHVSSIPGAFVKFDDTVTILLEASSKLLCTIHNDN